MSKIRAKISGIQGWVPPYILTNKELETMVETTDEWIMTRTGIRERHILKGEGLGTSDMGAEAVKGLLEKTGTKPEDIDLLICATVTPDMMFPATANIISDKTGLRNAFSFDINAACSGLLFTLITASKYIETGMYKKVIVVGADKMSGITDYTARETCVLFGDAAGAILLEPTTEEVGIMDSIAGTDGSGRGYLHMKAGGSLKPPSHETVDAREHFIYQEGQPVFKFAVTRMADVSAEIMERNNLIMMSVLQNAFANSSSSLIQSKVTGSVVFVLLPPISYVEFFLAYTTAAILRGLMVGLGVLVVTAWLAPLTFVAPGWIVAFAVLGGGLMGSLGMIAGIWADKFDQLAGFQNFLIMPFTMLSGVFYSIHSLPGFWQHVSHFNPVFYMIDGFRYGFFGASDISPVISLTVVAVSFIAVALATLALLRSGYKLRY